MPVCYGKDQQEHVIAKLTAVLKEVPTDELDGLIASARRRLAHKTKTASIIDIRKLFDTQIRTLKDRGCPEPILDTLSRHRDEVVSKASEMKFAEGYVPFLPVISRSYLTIYSQMPMVRKGDKVGYTYLKPSDIIDLAEMPAEPYYIFDVEDGQAMRGIPPRDAEKQIKEWARRGLTEVEVIALGIHTDVLFRHYVDGVGSRCVSDEVPSLWLSIGAPQLVSAHIEHGEGCWGAASCSKFAL